jgi:2-methylcitrate dehydratase
MMKSSALEKPVFVPPSSATSELARLTLDLRLEDMPPEALRHAKRLLIDSIACMLGGFHSPTGEACRKAARELGAGTPQASVIGERGKVSCQAAVIANQGMLRFLDYNDDIEIPVGPGDVVCAHPSGALPVAIAVGEWTGATGKQFVEAMIAGYEVIGRLLDSFRISLEVRSFHHGTVLSYAGAAMAGRLLGLSQDQLVQAMGIGGSASLTLGILDAEGEEYVMTKNLVDGLCAERGMLGAVLARHGMTGPGRIIEGNKGFADVVLGGTDKFRMREARTSPFITETVIKYICAEATTHGHLTATKGIMAEQNLSHLDVEEITIFTNKRSVFHTGDPVKKFPRNKESADHSAYFLTAATVLHGEISPKTYTSENYQDPRIIELIGKIKLAHAPEFDYEIPSAEVEIRTRSGKIYRKCVRAHELVGSPERPMSDDDVRAKFMACVDGLMERTTIDRILEACARVETLERFDELTSLLVL